MHNAQGKERENMSQCCEKGNQSKSSPAFWVRTSCEPSYLDVRVVPVQVLPVRLWVPVPRVVEGVQVVVGFRVLLAAHLLHAALLPLLRMRVRGGFRLVPGDARRGPVVSAKRRVPLAWAAAACTETRRGLEDEGALPFPCRVLNVQRTGRPNSVETRA